MANYNDGVSEDLDTFSNIRYTPAWYYKKWPGFLNVESYKILAAWDKGVRIEEEWLRDQGMEEGTGEGEEEEFMLDIDTDTEFDREDQNKKKRKQMTVILEEGGGSQPPL